MPFDIVVTGDKALEVWLGEAPGKLVEDIQTTTEHATNDVILPAVQGDTPVRTGALRGSERAQVTKTALGATGRVYSDIRYVSFVDRGTRKHGAAQRMFERGQEQSMTAVTDLFEGMAVKFTETAK